MIAALLDRFLAVAARSDGARLYERFGRRRFNRNIGYSV
jgi:hypothetical protein